jgi:hypothetical protein
MAGEYSRELSAKVFAGQCRLIELGYRQGGIAGYGLRRMRVDQHGQMLGLLRPGERKSLQTDRVILVPGPADKIATVDRIYRLFVEAGKTEAEIAEILNGAGTATDLGRPWTRGSVHQVLSNEKYIGNSMRRLSGSETKCRQHGVAPGYEHVRPWSLLPATAAAARQRGFRHPCPPVAVEAFGSFQPALRRPSTRAPTIASVGW